MVRSSEDREEGREEEGVKGAGKEVRGPQEEQLRARQSILTPFLTQFLNLHKFYMLSESRIPYLQNGASDTDLIMWLDVRRVYSTCQCRRSSRGSLSGLALPVFTLLFPLLSIIQ